MTSYLNRKADDTQAETGNVNDTSETFSEFVGPSYFLAQDKLTITFFGRET